MITPKRWYTMPLIEQLSNVGCDLDRAVRRRNEGNIKSSKNFFSHALELFSLTINDPKNYPHQNELIRVKNSLIDYFVGNNENDSTDEQWYDYFMYFNYLYALQKRKQGK